MYFLHSMFSSVSGNVLCRDLNIGDNHISTKSKKVVCAFLDWLGCLVEMIYQCHQANIFLRCLKKP